MSDNSLINLGDLSKPATVLIEKISDAITGIAKPYQTRRVAHAEADAALIAANAQMQIDELQRRALERFVREEALHQANIEGITQKAIPLLTDGSKPEDISNDWLANFFDKSRIVSSDEMQDVWAHILAREANSPGTFSRKTVNLVADLDRSDAELFTKLCSFAATGWDPLVFDFQDPIYVSNGMNFSRLSHLESLGLVQLGTVAGFKLTNLAKQVRILYFDRILELTLQNEANNDLDYGHVTFTNAGRQLARVVSAAPIAGFLDHVVSKLQAKGIQVLVVPAPAS